MSGYAYLIPWGVVVAVAVIAFVMGKLYAEPAPQTYPPLQPAGKDGVPGLFQIEVTGQRDVDIPAIQAAYLGR